MFTGLVTEIGRVIRVAPSNTKTDIDIACAFSDLALGESVSCDGACLTVTAFQPGQFSVSAVSTTISRTLVGAWTVGSRVNLERALSATGRFGGHLVLGHVDGIATLQHVKRRDDDVVWSLTVERDIWDLMVPRGSVALHGVSLTVAHLPEPGVLEVALIPHTLAHTNLGSLGPGARLNVEADMIGKYVRRFLAESANR